MDATAGGLATRRRADRAQAGRRAVEGVLAVVVLALWASAFVGLGASSYWADELWTLFVVDHAGGVGEVARRALTDGHPPAFYLIIHAWVRLFGDGETATRSFSALCAVAAGVVFVGANGAAFSRPGRLFGAAVGATSLFWFKQSQNMRSYGLAMLLLVGLLSCAAAARRQNRAGEPVSWALCGGIAGLGLLGAFTHYYLFLVVGLLYLALLVSVPDRRLRVAVVASGVAILATLLPYMQVERSHIVFTNSWFSNDPQALTTAARNAWELILGDWAKRALLVLLIGAIYGFWRRRARGPAAPATAPLGDWLAGVSLFLMVGLVAAGLAASFLVEPSFSARNLMIAAPCVWFVAAWIYDQGASSPRAGLAFGAVATVLIALELLVLNGRLLNRTEDWRGSAEHINAQAACRGRDIPVVLPSAFGPDTPFFRGLAERDFFGWYYRGGGRLLVQTTGELASSRDPRLVGLLGGRASGADPCPVLAWGVHDLHDGQAEALAQALSRRPEVQAPVTVRRFASYRAVPNGWRPGWPAGYVFERARPASR